MKVIRAKMMEYFWNSKLYTIAHASFDIHDVTGLTMPITLSEYMQIKNIGFISKVGDITEQDNEEEQEYSLTWPPHGNTQASIKIVLQLHESHR